VNNPVATILQVILIATIAMLVVWLPLSNSNELMNGIQTAKSFNFFYGMFALVAIAILGFLFTKGKLKMSICAVDVLLLAFVVWVTVNKYLLHDVHSLSLRYFELLGLVPLYIIVRTLNKKYTLHLLLAICVSGAVQAVYGNLQLWGYYPSHHGLFKMTGSFFNPGPYAGFLCAVLPVAVGLYWINNNSKFQVSGLTTLRSVDLRFRLRQNLLNRQLGTWSLKSETSNLKPVIIKCISVTTIITILLVLPAARSRAAWLGAIAGVAYLAWHKYNIANWLKQAQPSNAKHEALRSSENRNRRFLNLNLNLNSSLRKWLTVSVLVIFVISAGIGLYHFKKDSADGRMLIWTVTANIIKDNPLLGVGQDMFKAHYMDYQAGYFRNHQDSKYEVVADDNQYAFNEALNIWVENGIVGILLAAGIVFLVFFTPLKNFRLQISNSRLSSIQNESDRSGDETLRSSEKRNRRSQTCKLTPITIGAATITRAAILSILVFGLFAYPGEILPIKIVAVLCLGLLANYLASNGVSKPGIWKQNRRSTERSVVKPVTFNMKPLFIAAILLITIIAYPKINALKSAYITWNDAFDLYNYGLYEESIEDYKKAYPVLKHNGAYLINYGKALSLTEKHTEAVTILKQAKSYQSNSVLYTALGDSYKALEKYKSAEQQYSQAANMSPTKFYPLYLLAKLYDASGQQQNALAMANTILHKEVKVHSKAIDEIKEEMKIIIK
jgi:tetratricopeptide (TPR) repeat protein